MRITSIAFKATYGPRLTVKVAVDEISTSFSSKDVESALTSPSNSSSIASNCQLHDQKLQKLACEPEEWLKECSCEGAGKQVLMISGPEGFISKYAGTKQWSDGRERQGDVSGVIGSVMNANPGMATSWLILKL